ncbi:MAG: CRISPR-associated endonuclease Cas2 [Desulfovibrionales bacterium]|nr:MAG: CRISPR-associated endonuclease Cas2 [Desulfovibrionales bacterium]
MERLYIVCYDIRDPRRWRKLYKALHGFGEWMQLSVFQCRLNTMRKLRLEDAVSQIVKQDEDHVLIMDLGPAENVKVKVTSIGGSFVPVSNDAVVV